MFIRKSKLALAVASVACLALPASAYATNGYFAHGYGTKSKALGGATAALPQDAMVAATNPAGMAFIGDRWDFGMEFFAPNRGYSITGSSNPALNQSQGSEGDFFVVPHMGINFVLPWQASFGISVYGNGGMNTQYAKAVFGGAYGGTAPAGVDLMQMFVPLTYAQHITKDLAVGLSVIPVYQLFKADGLTPFGLISSSPNNVSNKGYNGSTGIGFRIGAQGNLPFGLSLGAAYQPKIDMTEFDKYKGLFAENGDFDIPSNFVIGAAWKITSKLTLAFDYERINYTDVKSVSNSAQLPPPSGQLLGQAEGPGFGWADINVYKLGIQFETGDWTWRAGWNHGDNPIEADPVNSNGEVMFNILAPGVIEDHVTLGFTKKLNPTTEVSVMYMHAFENSVSGSNPVIFGGGQSEISMFQNSVELSIGGKF